MVFEFIFGLAILGVAVYILFRILGDITIGVVLVLVVFFASYLLIGSLPDLNSVPLVGSFIPKTGDAVALIKSNLYSLNILTISRDSNNNLLVTVQNTGKLDETNFMADVDNKKTDILNFNSTLKSGDAAVLELNWKGDFQTIKIQSDQAQTTYPSK